MASNSIAKAVKQSDTLHNALYYDQLGWHVIPLCRGTKKPLVPWKAFELQQSSPAQLAEWFAKWPEANIGIVAGRNLAILDVDDLRPIEGRHLPLTPTVRTQRGWHYYFWAPSGLRSFRMEGLEVKAQGGYVVAPYSVHPSGAVYQWAPYLSPEEVELACLPDWLLERAPRQYRVKRTEKKSIWKDPSQIITAPRPCINRLEAEGVSVGYRHLATMRVALDWRRRLCRELTEDELFEVVLKKSLKFYAPLRQPEQGDWTREVRQIVTDIMTYGGNPHNCSDPFLRDRCVSKRICPFYRAIEQLAQRSADLSIVPSEVTGAERKVAEAIIKLYARYRREVGDWLVTSQSDVAEVAGLSRQWVNRTLKRLEATGFIYRADGGEFLELINAGVLAVRQPRGTLLRWVIA